MIAERSGIEIDYCPKCRGVWLDRGELDKIIDRSAAGPAPTEHRAQYAEERPAYRDERGGYGQKPYRKKKESFLGELFDF